MRIIKRVLWGTAAIAIIGSLVPPTSAPDQPNKLDLSAPAAAAQDNPCYKFSGNERSFTSKMNQERNKANKSSMRLDPELSKVAMKHTQEMIKKNLLHHTDSTAFARRVIGWSFLGENVGVGGTVDSLHEAFMNSPSHKANIMDSRFKFVGVGSKQAGDKLWVTVVFESSANPSTSLRMPRC